MRYRLVSRDTATMDWEPGEIILTGEELDEAIHHLMRVAVVCNLSHGQAPVWITQIGPRELMYISFEEIE